MKKDSITHIMGLLFLVLVGLLWTAMPALAQEEFGVVSFKPDVRYVFGEWVLFEADLTLTSDVKGTFLAFREEQSPSTFITEVQVGEDGAVEYLHQVSSQSIRAFVNVDYWFMFELVDGRVIESEVLSFHYEDNRFAWQQLSQEPFRVFWYGSGDLAFAQQVMNKAQEALVKFRGILDVETTSWIDIYVYEAYSDYQVALSSFGPLWAGGHADPALGVAAVSIPDSPGRMIQVERKIPHEVSHIFLYQSIGDAHKNIPIWLVEGLASYNELFYNPDYNDILSRAYNEGKLMPMSSLCQVFPRDAGGALLAYAQSESLTRFIIDKYGSAGMKSLVEAHARGESCSNGPRGSSIGQSLADVERSWRAEMFGEQYLLVVIQSMLPWIGLLVVVAIGPLFVLFRGGGKPGDDQIEPVAYISKK